MRANLSKQEWDEYTKNELERFSTILANLGIVLDEQQLHTGGERYLMSGQKLVLTGTRTKDGTRVVLKLSTDPEARKEIQKEKQVRDILNELSFANDTLSAPEEILYADDTTFTLFITAFIEQPEALLSRPLQEQFFAALRALESQEGFHATTHGHERHIRNVFPILRAENYLTDFAAFEKMVANKCAGFPETISLMRRAGEFLHEHHTTIERYAPYLAHTDLVPHNMRVTKKNIFLLDYAAFHFGNKYESWARFLNYLLIHGPELERLLSEYVRNERGEDEYLSLRLMRAYKIGFLLEYYARSYTKTEGDLRELTKARIELWTKELEAILEDVPLSPSVMEAYTKKRDELRSEEEMARQREIAKVDPV